ILIVDDERANMLLLERLLQQAGYRHLASTTDSRTALELYRGVRPDLILLGLMMPHVDGLAVLAQLRAEIPETVFVPVLVLTADVTPDSRRGALAAGAHDFLTKPFEAFVVLLRIGNLLATRRLYLALEEHNRALEDTVRQRPAGEGTGLGLSLCRGIVEEHHGTITVDSEPGRGTTLLIELPVETPPRAAPRPAAASAPSAVRPGKVLLVDDERAVAEALAEAIRRDGHEVEIAGDGAEALGLLAARPHDLIVSDTKMPVLDGESFYRELERRHPALRERIVFLTGHVFLDGERIERLRPHEIAGRGVARTFQISKLFGNMTVLENVLVPALAELDRGARRAPEQIRERARRLLDLVLLDGLRDAPAKELSGGQSMLLQIARGLMLQPIRLFLMDEPFAGVHPTIKDTIMATILNANRDEGVTFLIVSHEMATLRRLASRVSVMHERRLIAEGSFEAVANQPAVLEAYLGG